MMIQKQKHNFTGSLNTPFHALFPFLCNAFFCLMLINGITFCPLYSNLPPGKCLRNLLFALVIVIPLLPLPLAGEAFLDADDMIVNRDFDCTRQPTSTQQWSQLNAVESSKTLKNFEENESDSMKEK